MLSNAFFLIVGLSAISFVVALGALLALSVFTQKRTISKGFMSEHPRSAAFLFEEETLVNATTEAHSILSSASIGDTDWSRFHSIFAPRFDALSEKIATLADTGYLQLQSIDGISLLEAEWRDGLARIIISDMDNESPRVRIDELSLTAMQTELETLRNVAESAAFLVWKEQSNGSITWANRAYLELAGKCDADAPVASWPPPRIFETAKFRPESHDKNVRMSVQIPGEAVARSFEVTHIFTDGENLFTAVAADNLVRAEVALGDFVQTLTKTFAHLKIGLAIFDKQRCLKLFNPALIDLTNLSPDFLTGKPTLQKVLDQLREKRMIPEPKDYKSWRQRLHDLETAASEGTYEETWSLASGQTFRVVGRPHPDGAVAFLFEDISAEISLTRRYRAQLDTGQAVIDSLNESIAVFSSDGTLVLVNKAYAELWKCDPSSSISNYTILNATTDWARACAPTPVWGDIREFVGAFADRTEWSAVIQASDGRQISARFVPLTGGNTLVGFVPAVAEEVNRDDNVTLQPRVHEGILTY